jgi:hypothetical protein
MRRTLEFDQIKVTGVTMQPTKPVVFNGVGLIYENDRLKICLKGEDNKWREIINISPLELVADQIIVVGALNSDGPINQTLSTKKQWA